MLASMPFFVAYWSYVLGAILLYAILHLSWSALSSRQQQPQQQPSFQQQREQEVKEEKKRRRREAADDSDADENLDEDVSGPGADPNDNVAFVPYRGKEYDEKEMIARSQSFYHFLNARRTLRFFSDRPVPREVMENLVRSAGTSPSGAHTEPWTYVVVAEKELKKEVRAIIEAEEEVNYRQRMGKEWTGDLVKLSTGWVKPYLTDAPYVVLLFKQTYAARSDGSRATHYYNEISCSISAGLFLAAVHHAGLVTLTSTPLNCGPALRQLLGRPQNEKLLICFPVGYPAEDATVPDLRRKDLDDVMVFMD